MEAWPINIICYAPDDARYELAQGVLPRDRGFSTEMAWSDRFLGRLLNYHRFDVLAVIKPAHPSDIAFCWQARRHSRCNSHIPMVILSDNLPKGLAQMVARTRRLSHIKLPSNPRQIQAGLLSAVLTEDAPAAAPDAFDRATRQAAAFGSRAFASMPTAMTQLFDGSYSVPSANPA